MKQCLLLLSLFVMTSPAFSWDKDAKYVSPPLLNGRSSTVETKPMLFAPANQKKARLSAGWLQNIEWNELNVIASRLAKKAEKFNQVRSYNNFSIVTDKRFFLVSVNPDVMLVVPHQFAMSKDRDGKSYWHDGSISNELQEILKKQRTLYGLTYLVGGLQGAGLSNDVEMSSLFPNVDGILVLSDLFESAVPLSEAEKHEGWRFAIDHGSDMPNFAKFIPKEKSK